MKIGFIDPVVSYIKSLRDVDFYEKLVSDVLLLDDEFRSSIDSFAIRYHNAMTAGKHFDYTFGFDGGEFVVDFIIPGKLSLDEIQAHDALPKGNIPKTLLFMEAHDPSYHFSDKKLKVIKKGYGAGTWINLEREETKVIKIGESFKFSFKKSEYLIEKKGTSYKIKLFT